MRRDPRIFDAEFFPRLHAGEMPHPRRLWPRRFREGHDAQVRHERQSHAPGFEKLHDARIDEFDLFAADPIDGQFRAVGEAWQGHETGAALARAFGDPHQHDNAAIDLDDPGIERADDLEVAPRGGKIGGPQQEPFAGADRLNERLPLERRDTGPIGRLSFHRPAILPLPVAEHSLLDRQSDA